MKRVEFQRRVESGLREARAQAKVLTILATVNRRRGPTAARRALLAAAVLLGAVDESSIRPRGVRR